MDGYTRGTTFRSQATILTLEPLEERYLLSASPTSTVLSSQSISDTATTPLSSGDSSTQGNSNSTATTTSIAPLTNSKDTSSTHALSAFLSPSNASASSNLTTLSGATKSSAWNYAVSQANILSVLPSSTMLDRDDNRDSVKGYDNHDDYPIGYSQWLESHARGEAVLQEAVTLGLAGPRSATSVATGFSGVRGSATALHPDHGKSELAINFAPAVGSAEPATVGISLFPAALIAVQAFRKESNNPFLIQAPNERPQSTLSETPDQQEVSVERDNQETLPAPEERSLIAGLLPLDLDALQHHVDHFFSLLGSLNENWEETHATARIIPWLIPAAVATLAYVQVYKKDSRERFTAKEGWMLGWNVPPTETKHAR